MTARADYEASICQRLGQAEHVKFRAVSLPGGRPKVADCHCNVNIWVKENPGTTVVRGWVTRVDFGLCVELAAHSVVRGPDGKLFDITQLENENEGYRTAMLFVPHLGDEQLFFEMEKLANTIRCPKG